ncbi:MAG: aminomethyltransferase family protein [Gammaproteobacteria bacterium]|nr:aminomethyltransferase family protein [Gammaproteobacteria bacterium]
MAAAPSLQDGIDRAGSPVKLLWKPSAPPFKVPVVAPEYTGWREEQRASQTVAFSDLSHHMSDLFLEGPDSTRLLRAVSANDFEHFAVGQAKQFVPVTEEGFIVTDGILLRTEAEKYILSGVPSAQNWVKYHGEKGGYEVSASIDPDSAFRRSGNPVLFRYQIQGRRALELTERAFGGPLPQTRFFHSTEVTLRGRRIRALRHGMLGQPGYEFIGAWEDGAEVKDALLGAGKDFGLTLIGGLAYATNGIESGWIPTPTPGIYLLPELADYRRWLSLFSFEGQKPLHGTFVSEDIRDYYVSPYELGYGRSIAFNHDFIGRGALEKAKDHVRRAKVTLVFNQDDVREVFGSDPGYVLSYARYRVEARSKTAGMTFYSGYIHPQGTILGLALVERAFAAPGTEVTVVWGEHPGPGSGTLLDADVGYKRMRATVQPAPYDEFARTQYRKD